MMLINIPQLFVHSVEPDIHTHARTHTHLHSEREEKNCITTIFTHNNTNSRRKK